MPPREGTAGLLSRSLSFDSFKKAFLPTQESSQSSHRSHLAFSESAGITLEMSGQDLRLPNCLPFLTASPGLPLLFTSILKKALPHILYHILLIITLLKKGFLPFIDEDSQRGLEPCPHTVVAVPEFEPRLFNSKIHILNMTLKSLISSTSQDKFDTFECMLCVELCDKSVCEKKINTCRQSQG